MSTATTTHPTERARSTVTRKTRILALAEMRWAAAALVLVLLAVAIQLPGGPPWLWGPIYAA